MPKKYVQKLPKQVTIGPNGSKLRQNIEEMCKIAKKIKMEEKISKWVKIGIKYIQIAQN